MASGKGGRGCTDRTNRVMMDWELGYRRSHQVMEGFGSCKARPLHWSLGTWYLGRPELNGEPQASSRHKGLS